MTTALPPVLEDTRDLLLCLYMVLTDEVTPKMPMDWALHLGWGGVDAPDGKWLASLIWGDVVGRIDGHLRDHPAKLARVINSFEGVR